MKKLFAGIACLIVIASGVFLLMFRSNLVYLPGTKAIRIQDPRYAFSLDAGYAVVDQSGKRMLFMDKNLNIKWIGSSGSMMGTILGAAGKKTSNDIFCIDSITLNGNEYQRLMRVDALTGIPQETLKQFKVSDNEIFIEASLALEGEYLYYLQRDKSGITFLMRRNTSNKEEKSLFRTKWGIESATLAVFENSIYILAEGQLFLYKAGILQTIPEIESKLQHIDAICKYDDKLLLVDGSTGTIYSYSQNGILTKTAEAAALLTALAPKPENTSLTTLDFLDKHLALAYESGGTYPATISSIVANSATLILVDSVNSRIVLASGTSPEISIQGATLNDKNASLVSVSWIMLASGIIAFVALVFLGLFSLHAYKNNLVTFTLALLPAALLILLVLVLLFYNTERNRLLAQQKDLENQLALIAKTTVSQIDGDTLSKSSAKLFQKDFSSLAFKSVLSKIDYKGTNNVLLAVCAPYKTYPAVLADNINSFREGQPVHFVSSKENANLLKLGPAFSAVRLGDRVRLQALHPIADSKGGFSGFVAASLMVAALDAGSLFRYVLHAYYLYLILAAAGVLVIAISIRMIGTRIQEPAHITKKEATQPEDETVDLETSPVLDDTDFDIPVIPDIGFKESYSSSNVFDMTELPPLAGVETLQPMADMAIQQTEPAGGNKPGKAGLKPSESLFARASKIQSQASQEQFEFDSDTTQAKPDKPRPQEPPVPATPQAAKLSGTTGSKQPPVSHSALELHVDAVDALKTGNYSLAVSLLERVLQLAPDDAKALNNLGIAYKRSGNTVKAIQCFEKALTINPADEALAKNLAILKKAQS